jgi:DNA-binding SARP family transcriptional activator
MLRGNTERSLQYLQKFLSFSNKVGTIAPGYGSRADAAALLSFALAQGFHIEDVRALIVRTRLVPSPNDIGMNWPWPVKIFVLGGFVVMKDDAPLVQGGKALKKPLELLGLLIALGGREVGVNNLAQLLWPDTEGDLARVSLRATLLRLRRLIGDAAVTQQGGCLSLNPECCWLDLWAFERVCDAHADDLDAPQRIERMFALYGGAFLPDNDETWTISQRERLRAKALRTILDIGRRFEDTGRIEAAIAVYQKGIEVDALAEELYRRLMRCYLHANRAAEALALYQHYRTLLSHSLNIEPAAETRSLFQKIQLLAV